MITVTAPENTKPADTKNQPANQVKPLRRFTSVVTRLALLASRTEVWEALLFYEQIRRPPPLVLRLLLPLPLRTKGRKSDVGDEIVCDYQGGQLLKTLTRIEPGCCYEFDVTSQNLRIGGGISLLGGGYTLLERSDGFTDVVLSTRYASPHRPRWLCEPIEAWVCHAFHLHILAGIRDNLPAHARTPT